MIVTNAFQRAYNLFNNMYTCIFPFFKPLIHGRLLEQD